MSSTNLDQLYARFPRLVDELDEQLTEAIKQLNRCAKASEQPAAWRKGITDALRILEPSREALFQLHKLFAELPRPAGVTDEEIKALLIPLACGQTEANE